MSARVMTEADWQKLEAHLRAEAERKWPGNKARQDKYVYGGKMAMGWRPKGRA